MQITAELIESLLWESEGPALDFKSRQYALADATDDQKSELVKDILAFANAFRRGDAFILVGVNETKGGRAEVVGVATQLEDAHIQQLLSAHVQRPIVFSYRAMTFDNLPIGVIHIPKQKRPFYGKRDFGKIRKGAVYVRRGSATEIAMPDEIAAMGADHFAVQTVEPRLEISFFDRAEGRSLGDAIAIKCLALQTPQASEIPDYVENRDWRDIMPGYTNPDYYRELVRFTCLAQLLQPISFTITNFGDVLASDVRLVFEVDDPANVLYFCDEIDRPYPPEARGSAWSSYRNAHSANVAEFEVTRTGSKWRVACQFGKIQPKDSVCVDADLYVGALESGAFTFALKMFADNLSHPVSGHCQVTFEVDKRTADLEAIERLEFERFSKTPEGQMLLEEQSNSPENDTDK